MPSNPKRRDDGIGSLYQVHAKDCERPKRCPCPWRGAYVLGYRDGKAIRKTVSAKTRAACSTRLEELKDRYKVDELPEGKPITVEDWMKHWLSKVVARKNTPSTAVAYGNCVRHYIVPLLGRHRLDKLTSDHIEEAWEQLLDDGNPRLDASARRPLSANTVHLTHRVLARSLRVAVQKKKLRTNPAGPDSMDAPPRIEEEIEPIPTAEIEKILAAAEGTPNAARWTVALALGLRPGEALGLRWSDIDLDEGVLTVNGQLQRQTGQGLVLTKTKTKKSRAMYLPASLHAAMKAHRKTQTEWRLRAGDQWHDSDAVFTLEDGRPLDPRWDRKLWHRLLADAGVPHRRLYDARHSAATMLLAQGVGLKTVMELLGHTNAKTTLRYEHAVDEIKAAAAKAVEAGMFGA